MRAEALVVSPAPNLPEEQHEGCEKCSEIGVALYILSRVESQVSKHLDNSRTYRGGNSHAVRFSIAVRVENIRSES